MEKRTVELTLEKAKEWYKKGGELKEVALQAFKEKELKHTRSYSWEEFCQKHSTKNYGYFIGTDSTIHNFNIFSDKTSVHKSYDRNVYPTKEYAEAALALCQLLQLRQEWIGDWKPDWTYNDSYNYVIVSFENLVQVDSSLLMHHTLSFPTEEMATKFYDTFKDLVEIAKPLI